MGTALSSADPGPGDGAARAVDVRRAPRWAQRGRDRSCVERARRAVPVGYRPGAESAPRRAGVEPAVGHGDPANPRYTGRQVWSRQRSLPGAGRSMVAGEWAVSRALSHSALVSEADFVAVQQCRAARKCEDGARRAYVLAGLVQCRVCGRRMDAHWVNARAGYRCRHGHRSAQARPPDAACNIYVREDVLLVWLARHVASDRHRSGGDVEPSTVEEVVAGLRAQSKVIVCGRADWTLAPAGRMLLSGPTIAPALIGMG